jgi:hypothetical protein
MRDARFMQNEARLQMIGVRAGTLDDPDFEKTADDHLDFKRAAGPCSTPTSPAMRSSPRRRRWKETEPGE